MQSNWKDAPRARAWRRSTNAFLVVALLPAVGCNSHVQQPGQVSALTTPVEPSAQVASTGGSPAQTDAVPRVVSWAGLADIEKFYPEEAARQGVDGLVRIAVTLDKEGRATDTRIVSETPTDLGFGAAASSLAHTLTYSNPTGSSAVVTFDVKFDLPPKHGQHHHHGHRAAT